jgi:two-component system nitrogen regulation sensor histidine kinase NtrY
MSLAVRLLLAFGVVAVLATALVGFAARDVAKGEVERGFNHRIDAAMNGARGELVWEADTLAELLTPLCKHDSFVDRTLLDLERAGGDVEQLPLGRGIGLRKLVPEQCKALRLDELVLITGDGEVLGADNESRLGTRERSLARRLAEPSGKPRLVWRKGEATIEVHCSRTSSGVTLGLIGARKIEPILERVGNAYGATLRLGGGKGPPPGPGSLDKTLTIDEIGGLEVDASISRQPMFEALAKIDSSIFLSGAIAVLLSVALAVFMARGLSQPIVELAAQTREVVRGVPKPIRGRGGRELEQLAHSFNRTIDQLTRMRRRLARTERIAARREVARQVAHEIKNPLAPIRAAVETLRRLRERGSPGFDEYFDEATRTVLDEVHRIKNIVSEFTKFARLPPPKFERLDLEELARGIASLHDDKDHGGGRSVGVQSDAVAAVLADRDQLIQVLTNLVQNGIEAASAERDDPAVTIVLEQASEREVRLVVSDNGPGIAADLRDRLFEPYVSTKDQGTGLGLAIVQTIVHEHGGEIRCENGRDGGARFEVVLPVDGPPLLDKAPTSTGDTTG